MKTAIVILALWACWLAWILFGQTVELKPNLNAVPALAGAGLKVQSGESPDSEAREGADAKTVEPLITDSRGGVQFIPKISPAEIYARLCEEDEARFGGFKEPTPLPMNIERDRLEKALKYPTPQQFGWSKKQP